MIGQKARIALAVIAAISVGCLLLGLTYAVFSKGSWLGLRTIGVIQTSNETSQTSLPTSTANSFSQVTSAFYWIGIVVAIAVVAALTVIIVNRVKTKKATENNHTA